MSSKVVMVYAGSFDPPTLGHVNIAERGACLCDELVIAVAVNTQKSTLFTVQERFDLISTIFEGRQEITVKTFNGLLVDFAESVGAKTLLRGLRSVGDFEYEMAMALANRSLKGMETIFMVTESSYSFISSTIIKEIVAFGGEVRDMVPLIVEQKLRERINNKE